jgi:hypothetical protein
MLALGCGDARTQPPAPATPDDGLASRFDPATAGTIKGTVAWSGELPAVKLFDVHFNPDSSPALREKLTRDNPNAPAIGPARGVSGAVVFLRAVDPERSRPWNHPPVSVEIRGRQIHVLQGSTDSRVGFVRAGDAIDMVSREKECQSLHASGSAFFTLPFPDPDQPLSRSLTKPGVVELSSNSGLFWIRSYLFVVEHPYYARTDAEGNFLLTDVPAGEYELVAWLPSWKVKDHDRDPETGFISRVRFEPPVEVVHRIRVAAGEKVEQRFEFSLGTFVGR